MPVSEMHALDDHYTVLGVPKGASPDEVKKAYRALSRLHHPDKAGHLDDVKRHDCERRMVALNVAYQVLSSPRQRNQYDLSRPLSPPLRRGGSEQRDVAPAPGRSAGSTATASAGAHAAAAEAPGSGWEDEAELFGLGRRRMGAGHAAPRMPSCGPSSMPAGAKPKPRYQLGAKYTQRSRQARRMDPGQYTTHVDGRAAEFPCGAPTPGVASERVPSAADYEPTGSGGSTPSGSFFAGVGSTAAGVGMGLPGATKFSMPAPIVKNASWLQRQMDVAREWEQTHCPEPAEKDAYQWRKASNTWLQSRNEMRERRAAAAGTTTDGDAVSPGGEDVGRGGG